MLNSYFSRLTHGATLCNRALLATLLGFVPLALVGWNLGDVTLLWLAITLFMVRQAGLLLRRLPATLNDG